LSAAAASADFIVERDDSLLGDAGAAWFSLDRRYRYLLTRTWDATLPVMTLTMLNPSKAGAFRSDPTCTRCIGFARRENCGGLAILNAFALCTTDPAALALPGDPVGPANDQFLEMHAKAASLVVVAWGAGGSLHGRAREVGQMLAAAGVPLKCLGVTKDGHPRHPLYVRADTPLIPWEAPS
jgi:hypothetical protein